MASPATYTHPRRGHRDPWRNIRAHPLYVGFEVLTAVVMKGAIFWDVNRRFGILYRLHLQGRRNIFSKKPVSKQVATHGHIAAGRIRSIEKSNDLVGNRTRDFRSCRIVSLPTTLPRSRRIS
jgi:hypothetical protein